MPAPTLPVTPVPSEDPKKKKEVDDDKGKGKGKGKEETKDVAKVEEGEELVSDQNARMEYL